MTKRARREEVREILNVSFDFDALPVDVLSIIFSHYTRVYDVFMMRQVCHRFKEAVSRLLQNPPMRFVMGLRPALLRTYNTWNTNSGRRRLIARYAAKFPREPSELVWLHSAESKTAFCVPCSYATCRCGRPLQTTKDKSVRM